MRKLIITKKDVNENKTYIGKDLKNKYIGDVEIDDDLGAGVSFDHDINIIGNLFAKYGFCSSRTVTVSGVVVVADDCFIVVKEIKCKNKKEIKKNCKLKEYYLL